MAFPRGIRQPSVGSKGANPSCIINNTSKRYEFCNSHIKLSLISLKLTSAEVCQLGVRRDEARDIDAVTTTAPEGNDLHQVTSQPHQKANIN